MLELLSKQINLKHSREDNIFLVKEFLQLLILKVIDDAGYFKSLVFTGGTALRIIYGLNRFSEDLDFSFLGECLSIMKTKNKLQHHLSDILGFNVLLKTKTDKIVQSIDLHFKDLLFQYKLSTHHNQDILIRIEIDTNPPQGGNTSLSLNNRFFFLTIRHYDLPSLFATKLHACFYRKYTKGRDVYDLIWYLGKNIYPNFTLLNNAITQTEGIQSEIDKKNFIKFLIENIKNIDFKKSRNDVKRFLFDKSELKLFDYNLLIQTIKSKFH